MKASASDLLIDKINKLTKLNEKESSEVIKDATITKIANLELQIAEIILKEGLLSLEDFAIPAPHFPCKKCGNLKTKFGPKKHLLFL